MTYFVIVGITNCPLFNHAKYVADFLQDHLPDFKVQFIEKEAVEYKIWLKETNIENHWYHTKSPIIWKELTMRGGRAHLIGGLSEFWEYCYDYYSLESILTKYELEQLIHDSMQYNTSLKEMYVPPKTKIICIFGNVYEMTKFLILELLQLNDIFDETDLIIRIPIFNDEWKAISEEFKNIEITIKFKFEFVHDLQHGLAGCQLLILTGDFAKGKSTEFYDWLDENYEFMLNLSKELNSFGERYLRIILAMHGPVCFNAMILKETVTVLHRHNIVAVSADLGLEALNTVSKYTNTPLEELGAPPVWGFIGINQLVDVDRIVQKTNIYRPNSRAVKNIFGTTLQLGKNYTELRYMSYLTHEEKNYFWRQAEKDKKPYFLPKIRAVISLIKNWYSTGTIGNIISLGIISNGSFNIPKGIYFSQPAILENDVWIPAEKYFPASGSEPGVITDLLLKVYEILKHYQIHA